MKKKNLTISIKILTGLHIGIGNDKPEIGGIDNQFIKDPISKMPYIPGSSLKGKLKSLLLNEYSELKHAIENEIKKVFEGDESSPTRLIFRDTFLNDNYLKKFQEGEIMTEVKTEIKIHRLTGKVEGPALRSTERVPPGVEFKGQIIVRYLNEVELNSTEKLLNEAIKLLNNDFLGGSGSRGYGAVKVTLN